MCMRLFNRLVCCFHCVLYANWLQLSEVIFVDMSSYTLCSTEQREVNSTENNGGWSGSSVCCKFLSLTLMYISIHELL